MFLERKEDLSVYYFLQGAFPGVNIEDGFPDTELVTIPTVAVEAGKIDVRLFEIGNRTGLRVRKWDIDIFAKNKSQRDEFGYKLLNDLKNGIAVYDYDQGFPPSISPDKIGQLQVEAVSYLPIKIVPQLVKKLYYRATVSFVAYNDSV